MAIGRQLDAEFQRAMALFDAGDFFTNTTGTIWQSTSSIGSGGSDSASPSGGQAIQ